MRIRTAIVWGTLVHATVAGLTCAALVISTTVMHRRVNELSDSMDSLRRATQVGTTLLLHRFTEDGAARVTEANALRELVGEIAPKNSAERRAAKNLTRDVSSYLSARTEETARGSFVAALFAAQRLAIEHRATANDARARARTMDLLANMLGVGMGVFLILTVLFVFLWLRQYAAKPFLRLQSTMARFASGDANARVPERGPEEFRSMARTFNTTVSELQRARQDQLRYTGAILHDLRTPLSAIQLATEFVTDGAPLPGESRIRDLFNLIRRQVNRTNGIVGDALGVLRARSGDLTLLYEHADARALAQGSVEQLQTATVHHRLVLECARERVDLECDVRRIEQLVNNLVSNAIKYSPEGSEIRVIVDELPESVVGFSVVDHGRGIAKEDLERVFEPFQRAISAHEEIPGVGLGLFVSRAVARAHGGELEVESELGVGSTFRALIPAHPPRGKVET